MSAFQFKTPTLLQLVGPSCSGKSTLLREIIEKADTVFDRQFDQIIYACGVPLKELPYHPKLVVIDGPPDPELFENEMHQLCILDDLMEYYRKNKNILSDFFTKLGHHKNVSFINVIQSAFGQERTARSSSNYVCFMRMQSEKLSLATLGRQIFPGNFKYFMEAYDDIVRNCKSGYPHMLIDLHPTTDDRLRLLTDITSPNPIVYVPNSLRY